MKERKLYSLTGKLIVFLLLIVFAASALFGGIQTLMLSSVGLTPNAAAKKYAFEETTACGTLVQRQLHNVMSYYNDMSKFGINGRYDGTKEIDYRAFATDGEGSGGISTTYTIDRKSDKRWKKLASVEPPRRKPAFYVAAGTFLPPIIAFYFFGT